MALYLHRFSGGTSAGEVWQFTWHSDSGASLTAAQSAAETWLGNFWTGAYAAYVPTNAATSGVRTVEIDPATGQQQQAQESPLTLPGESAGNALPGDVALVCSLRTVMANRSGRGRFYMPQLAVNALTPTGLLNVTAQGDIVAALLTAFSGYSATGSPVVYSRTNRNFNNVVTFDVGNIFDTMRSRDTGLLEIRQSETMP